MFIEKNIKMFSNPPFAKKCYCGGWGKQTAKRSLFFFFLFFNLCLQICFWLLDNGFRVMIAACDTFRAGAVEQLRTHVRHLNALHPPASGGGPPSVLLYEKGYGKDAASIAMDAINFGKLDSTVVGARIINF